MIVADGCSFIPESPRYPPGFRCQQQASHGTHRRSGDQSSNELFADTLEYSRTAPLTGIVFRYMKSEYKSQSIELEYNVKRVARVRV